MAKRRREPLPTEGGGVTDELNLALPDGKSMSIEFKPMLPGLDSQRLQMTAVYAQNADSMLPALEILAAVQRKAPHREFRPGACRVVARTAAPPLSFRQVVVWERDSRGTRHRGTPEAPLVPRPSMKLGPDGSLP